MVFEFESPNTLDELRTTLTFLYELYSMPEYPTTVRVIHLAANKFSASVTVEGYAAVAAEIVRGHIVLARQKWIEFSARFYVRTQSDTNIFT